MLYLDLFGLISQIYGREGLILEKILFLFNPTGLMDRDMAYSFKKAGLNLYTEKITLGETQEGHSVELFSSEKMTQILDTFKPDMVFSFDGRGLDNEGFLAHEYAKRGVPFVTWFVDQPKESNFGKRYVRSNTIVFAFDRDYIPMLNKVGFDNIFYLPLATNPDRFKPVDSVQRQSKVCFVGESDYERIRYFASNIDSMVEGAGDEFYYAVKSAINTQRNSPGRDTWRIVKKALDNYDINTKSLPTIVKDMLEGFVEREASLRQRLEVIQTLSGRFDTIIYGDSLWGKAIKSGYMGKANYFNDDIVKVYNRYDIYVNVSRFQLKNAINQRPYDISACGGFLITDERHDLREQFDEDEMISFKSTDELVDKIKFFLHKDTKREQIARKAREKVLARHTYLKRIEEIMRVMK